MNKIIVGHYGSGKTEFSVNYAMQNAERIKKEKNLKEKKVAIIDLDIVNPYFRSREKYEEFKKKGIIVAGTLDGNVNNSDLPALPPDVVTYIEDESYFTVVDVGGDSVGAKVLGRYHTRIENAGYDMYMIVNANRAETQDAESVISYIRQIEASSKLKINGLINNTHMLRETTEEDVIKGYELCKEVEEKINIPLIYNIATKSLNFQTTSSKLDKILYIDKLYMRPDWL